MTDSLDTLQPRPMTPARFRAVMDQLSLPQARLQRLLGINKATSSRWATGAAPIPTAVALLLRLMAEGRVSIDELEAQAAVDDALASADPEDPTP